MLNLRAWLARRGAPPADVSPLADPPMDDLPAPLADIGRAGDQWPGWRYLGRTDHGESIYLAPPGTPPPGGCP
jgi:hypothetical protein